MQSLKKLRKKMNKLKEYIQAQKRNPLGEFSLGNAVVYVKEPLPETVDLNRVLRFVSDNMPSHLYSNVEMIYIGMFPFLKVREVDALFENGAIYLSSKIQTEQDLIKDLVHEIAHSFEESQPDDLYGDGEIEREFLGKRNRLFQIFKARGYQVSRNDFLNPDYDKSFDEFLYNDIGYETLGTMTNGLFISPYAATSLREYFANAFEEFFVNDMKPVQDLTPEVYKKLSEYLEF